MINLLITAVIGLIAGFTAIRLKVPAGAMVGSMLATAIYNIITGDAFLPEDAKIITQIAAGAFIGSSIRYKDVVDLKYMIKPALLMIVFMITLNVAMGYVMFRLTGIDLVTSLFATAPGGIVDMSLISSDMGADTSKVAILQMVRLLTVLAFFPSLMNFISVKLQGQKVSGEVVAAQESNGVQENSSVEGKSSNKNISLKEKSINLTLTLAVAVIAGLIGYKIKVPAGAMTFAMVAAGALNVAFKRGYMPLNLRRVTQVFAGILIGERMTYDDVIALKGAILPALILIFGIIIVNLCIGILISKKGGMDLITSLLASAPGGMSDMALIAKDLGGDAPKVAVLQLTRYVSTIAIFPLIIKFISNFL